MVFIFAKSRERTIILGSYVWNAATAKVEQSHFQPGKTGGAWLPVLATVSRNTGWPNYYVATDAPTVPAVAAVSREP